MIIFFPNTPNIVKDINQYFNLSPTLTPPKNSPNSLLVTSMTPESSTTLSASVPIPLTSHPSLSESLPNPAPAVNTHPVQICT